MNSPTTLDGCQATYYKSPCKDHLSVAPPLQMGRGKGREGENMNANNIFINTYLSLHFLIFHSSEKCPSKQTQDFLWGFFLQDFFPHKKKYPRSWLLNCKDNCAQVLPN